MNYSQFLNENKSRLIGYYLLSLWFSGRSSLETPYPSTSLSDDELPDMKTKLNACMPKQSMIIDLWEWDVHFESDLSDDWYFGALFGDSATADGSADRLADYFLERVEEHALDYDQHTDRQAFEALVRKESRDFITAWRNTVFDRYTVDKAGLQDE
jgi:hypothetical protein